MLLAIVALLVQSRPLYTTIAANCLHAGASDASMGGTEAAGNAEASMSEGKQNGSDNGSAAQSDVVSKVAGAASFVSAALAVASSAEDDARRKMATLEKVSRLHRACVCQYGRVDFLCSCSTTQLKRKLAEAEAVVKYAAAMKVRAIAARARAGDSYNVVHTGQSRH
jgi:hypothetical protein